MSVFPLNIPDKEDHPDKTAKLDNVASKYFETAAEINKKTKAIEENHEKILSLQSGYKGIVLIADSKTEDGDYRPGEDGVFPNCDNLVYDPLDTDKGFDVKFNLTNGVWTKYRVDLAIEKASDGEDLKDNTKFFNGKQIDIYTEGLVNSVKEVIDVDISTINKELETKVDALVGKNKFNKATITPNARIFNTGTTEPSEDGTFSVTGYMKVEGGQTYASTPPIRSFCFYDKYKNVVVGGSNDPQSSITIPNSVAFIRGTVFTSEIDTLQFEKGTSPTTYEEYKEKINNSNLDIEGFTIGKAEEGDTNPISGDALYKEVGVIDSRLEEKVSVIVGKNLFNKLDITADSQIYNTGLILAKEDGTLAVTGYMKVEEGQTYSSNPPIRRSCFYDKYKNVITGGGSDPQSSITIPNSVAFIRGTIFTTDIDTLQFEKGTPTAYEEYKEKIDNSKLDIKGFATGVSEEGNKLPISGDTLYKEIEVINKILETKISSVVGKNKFNKLDITADSQIYHTGLILPKEDGTLSVTNYMEVEEGETYASTPPIRSFCFYDKYKNVVAGGSSDPQSSVTIPNSVA
ncbi:hypothetical protein, partial [Polaribacter atrinae]|uniref:hypothetical protein n=1 Tax=Polaribacter atrinae TaxID=1333662 RepID=UPI0030FAB134